MGRVRIVALLIGVLLANVACSVSFDYETVELTIDNRTNSMICLYLSAGDEAAGRCLDKVEPFEKATVMPGCAYGAGADKAPFTVILTTRDSGHRLYGRTAECRVWQNSNRILIVEQQGENFLVSGPLP